jgi:hypothetical protein
MNTTLKLIRVRLEESFTGGEIEAVADLESSWTAKSPFGGFVSILAYAKPAFGRIVLGMTPNGNPFLSDPCWHSYRYSIHRTVEAGDLVSADEYVSSTSTQPAITPDSDPELFEAVAAEFDIRID